MLLRVYGVVFLLVCALLLSLSVASYEKAFADVVHVTLKTDRIGNQLEKRADVKLRGVLVGEVRGVHSDGTGATMDLALDAGTVGLIPENVSARLLPKTLFGEKFVDLVVPERASAARLGEGDVIPQDRSATAIELEKVLDNLLPLLRTVRPEKLNATLGALATALEGRGDKLGENLALVQRYFGELNPQLGTIKADLAGLADVSEIYADAAPDLVAMLRNFAVTTATIAGKAQVYAGFLAGTTGFATTARAVVAENADRIIEVNRVGRPTLSLLARYSPEYPCLARSLAESNDFIGKTFANGELHITLEVVRSRDPYRPGEEPAWGEHRGPSCFGMPRPAVPMPATNLDDGTSNGTSGRAVPGFLLDPTSGYAGSGEERAVVRSLVAPAMGRQADDVPDLATLLFGPMARGTTVSAT